MRRWTIAATGATLRVDRPHRAGGNISPTKNTETGLGKRNNLPFQLRL